VPAWHVRNLVRQPAGDLIVVFRAAQKAHVKVNRSIRQAEGINGRIAQNTKAPVYVLELVRWQQRRSEVCQAPLQNVIMVDERTLFNRPVESLALTQQLHIDLSENQKGSLPLSGS
jgi:hypothetical protein